MPLASLPRLSRRTHISYSLDRKTSTRTIAEGKPVESAPKVTIIHSTRHVVLSFGRVQELKDRFWFDEDIVREDHLVIAALLYQGFQDTISKRRKEKDAIIALHAVRLRDRLVLRQYTPLYMHRVQSVVELLEQCWRLVITAALENGDKDVVCAEVMDGFDDAIRPIRYDFFIVVKHGANEYFLYTLLVQKIKLRLLVFTLIGISSPSRMRIRLFDLREIPHVARLFVVQSKPETGA